MPSSQASPTSPMPFQPLTAGRRTKYSGARVFWVTIAIISILAVWSSVVDNHGRNLVADSHKLSRRGAIVSDPVFISSATDTHNGVDLDVCQLIIGVQSKLTAFPESATWFIPPPTNANSSKRTVPTRKLATFPTSSSIIASSIMPNRSRSSS